MTRDQILGTPELPSEVLHVPEWGIDVRVRALGGIEMAQFQQRATDREQVPVWLALYGLVDDAGKRLFGPDDYPALATKHGMAILRVAAAVGRLSKLDEDEDAAKNG